ncbi:AAA domain-containing protein [Pisolithus orientalis]|uniref:AAA domain-containing protein n=1 Tax=Pisolithus orientalis TaxID=936130 RepID=UPI00222492D5|nr:AAA domain-containing protein [Pisolithus orientalis]KAI6015013.1 AAA domain-containing protein [Pisolithus orientalis]
MASDPSSDTAESLRAFISRQRTLLSLEREAEIERTSLLLTNCTPRLLEQKGLALGSLGVVSAGIGLGGKTLVELERPAAFHSSQLFPPHTFRPGDIARVEENFSLALPKKQAGKTKKAQNADTDAKTSRSAEGVVYKVTDTRIVIALDPPDSGDTDVEFPDRCRVVKLANSITYDRMEKALDRLEKTVLPSSRKPDDKTDYQLTPLIRVLLGMSPPSKPTYTDDITFYDPSLNASQKRAVKFALAAKEVACIHGPPGTGKTHALIEVIRQLTSTPVEAGIRNPTRVLVCGASNLSVDNILERLLDLPAPDKGKGDPLKVTRIGHPARVMANEGVLESTLEVKASRSDQAALAKDVKAEIDAALDVLAGKGKGKGTKKPRGLERKKMWEDVRALRKEYRQREGGVVKAVLGESQIVLATCHTAGSRQLQNHTFDVVIIDEATQAMEVVCWVPIFKAKKLILAGDPMQLPPTILSLDKRRKNGRAKGPTVKGSPEVKQKTNKSFAKTTEKPQSQAIQTEAAREQEFSSSTDSDSDSVKGDEFIAEEDVTPVNDETETKPARPKKPEKRPILRPPRTLEATLFDRLEKMYGPGIKRLLNIQYRMHAQICEFPSKTLYASKLKSHESVSSHLLQDLPNTSAFVASEDDDTVKEVLRTPVIFFDTAGCEYFERLEGDGDEGSRCNENEATVVKAWTERLAGAGLHPSQIAIITPYQAQVTLLTSLLRPIYGPGLEIGTVDGMQGREKDAVIISLVRSNEKREVGFLKEKRRLNVAMTRAKRHLCVVGDSSTVQHGGGYLKKWLAWLEANADVRFAEV